MFVIRMLMDVPAPLDSDWTFLNNDGDRVGGQLVAVTETHVAFVGNHPNNVDDMSYIFDLATFHERQPRGIAHVHGASIKSYFVGEAPEG